MISDTHDLHNKVIIEECDILIHSGDWTSEGKQEEVERFAKWLALQPAKHIILVPGNHERYFKKALPDSLNWVLDHCPKANILIDKAIELEGIKFYGSPWTPTFGSGWAWNASRTIVESAHEFKPFIGDIWDKIPKDTEFLISHGMPYGILDTAMDLRLARFTNVGDRELLRRIGELKQLRHVVGGHLHAQGGKSHYRDGVWFHNAAICDDSYFPTRKPIIINY